jgi:N-methylhydantoinase B/oxoprolinase/acetone carboxylase alpha subunit
LIIMTPGGGGSGVPALRAPASIARDVEDGVLAADVASSVYGFSRTDPQAQTRIPAAID